MRLVIKSTVCMHDHGVYSPEGVLLQERLSFPQGAAVEYVIDLVFKILTVIINGTAHTLPIDESALSQVIQ